MPSSVLPALIGVLIAIAGMTVFGTIHEIPEGFVLVHHLQISLRVASRVPFSLLSHAPHRFIDHVLL